MSQTLLLPDSRPRVQKNVVRFNGINWTPIFCANCGADGGLVPEQGCNFVCYFCERPACLLVAAKVPGTFLVPDEVFWQRVQDEQLEHYGHSLSAEELVEVLKDGDSSLAKLARDRQDFNKLKMN